MQPPGGPGCPILTSLRCDCGEGFLRVGCARGAPAVADDRLARRARGRLCDRRAWACARPRPPTRLWGAPAPPTRKPRASTRASAKSLSRFWSTGTCASSCSAPTSIGWSAWRAACRRNLPTAALAEEGGANGPCGQLTRSKAVKVVFGPGTFLNEAAALSGRICSPRAALRPKLQAKQAQSTVYRKALAQRTERPRGDVAWRTSAQGHDGGLRRRNQRACDPLWPEKRSQPGRP